MANTRKKPAPKVATKPSKEKVVARKATTAKKAVVKPATANVKTVERHGSKDYTAPLTAIWVGLIMVFLVLILFKMY